MNERIEGSLTAVALSTVPISFTVWIIVLVNAIPNAYEHKAGIMLVSVIFAVCISIAVHQSLKVIVLAITGTRETMRMLGKPHRGESHYAGPEPKSPLGDSRSARPFDQTGGDPPAVPIDEKI